MGHLPKDRLFKIFAWFTFLTTLYDPSIRLVSQISSGNISALGILSVVVIGGVMTILLRKYLLATITVALAIISSLPKPALSSYIGFVLYTALSSIARRYESPSVGESTPIARRSARRTLVNLVLSLCLTTIVSIILALWLSKLTSSTGYFSPIVGLISSPMTRLLIVLSIVVYTIALTTVLTGVFTGWTIGLIKMYRRLKIVPQMFLEALLFIFILLYGMVIHFILFIPTGLSVGRTVDHTITGALCATFSAILSITLALIPVKAFGRRFVSLPKCIMAYAALLSLALYTTAVIARVSQGADIILAVFTPDFNAVFVRMSSLLAVANALDDILRYAYEILGVI